MCIKGTYEEIFSDKQRENLKEVWEINKEAYTQNVLKFFINYEWFEERRKKSKQSLIK